MAQIIILGSAAAVSDVEHDNTHFLLRGETSAVLVDCGSNPLGKLKRLGIDESEICDAILTHFHPDHVAGFPNMLMQMWLLGRRTPMAVHGLDHCIDRVEANMYAYLCETWPQFFPVRYVRIPEKDCAPLLDNDDFHIVAYPTRHFIPTIGLRILNKKTGKILAYSCDTEPISGLIDLARDADLLIHEAAGAGYGHSSAAQAGVIAEQSGARALYLIHYHVWNSNPRLLIDEARTTYSGQIHQSIDGDIYEF